MDVFGLEKGDSHNEGRWAGAAKTEHDHPDAAFFLYYQLKIGNNSYYANVKASKAYKSEVLYCIRDHVEEKDVRTDEPPEKKDW